MKTIDRYFIRNKAARRTEAGGPIAGGNTRSRFWRFLLPMALLAGRGFAQVPEPVGIAFGYKQIDGNELKLWALSPPGHTARDRRPAVLFFHGGGWVAGTANAFNRHAEYLAQRGMVAVQVEYRLVKRGTTESITPCIEDAKSSLRWVRSHAPVLGIDPTRIAAAGGSAGGQLAAFLGLMEGFDDPADDLKVSARPDAMMLLNPAIDLGPQSPLHNRGGADYRKVSPLYNVRAGAPPTLILSGASDKVIPASVLLGFAGAMQKHKVYRKAIIYPDQSHGFFNRGPSFYATLRQMDVFLASLGWLHGPPDEGAMGKLPPTPPRQR